MAKKSLIKRDILSPQQISFLSFYTDPKSLSFGNARESAVRAKYSLNYANNITGLMPDWLFDFIGNMNMVRKAERNLSEMLDLEVNEQVITMIGPLVDKETGQPIKKVNPNLLRIKQDTSKFVAERLNKDKYSSQQEIKHSGGVLVGLIKRIREANEADEREGAQ